MAEAGRVLILDDDAHVADTVSAMVAACGLEPRAAGDAETFFRLLAEWRPSHILLDLMMPDMDGVEVLRRLGEQNCQARIIISSGLNERVIDAAGRAAAEHRLKVAGRLPKPFRLGSLRELLLRASDPPAGAQAGEAAPVLALPTAGEISLAVAERAFELHYQPLVACRDGSLRGVEALLRWRRADGHLEPPGRFVPLAEREGLMGAISWQVFELGVNWLRRDAPTADCGLSMNLSARNLDRLDMADGLASLCEAAQVDPGRITLEMTETAAMDDPSTALELMTRLRVKGFRLALDDFGTGYSSMIQLARLPFSEIKLDKSFVMTALDSQESRTIVRSIVELGHALGLQAVAEGVENRATLELLATAGCDLAQGFYIGRPMPGDAVADWYRQYRPRAAGP
ncbi:EAL domain-containing response regulator [Spiribacter halobius]|uniref:Diguanylate phosphodiesterase n=1 Tax=Sediminicurvatus halobius TaxID=2182432 RepID=A0A2U2N9N4_9GAMM|nr:EAL domain-containing response regulator [Spiribacter halobius]PWG65780.1 diguanylate phosphodiesterase [Spiribacter halobius]UEX77821.1 EAL domain-containing response regulator [Spiribacter halobius]